MATRAGLFERTIVRIEKLGGMPSLDTLEQVSVALGVSPASLVFGEGAMVLVRMEKAETIR
ncbi:MAG TPA: hypothetical protein DCQ33_07345 [Nitrospira sp.]|nr:hypothetical protein [Nitrospira sp.]